MSRINFVLNWVEHGKSFIILGPGRKSWRQVFSRQGSNFSSSPYRKSCLYILNTICILIHTLCAKLLFFQFYTIFWKQDGFWSAGFIRSQLIRIHARFHSHAGIILAQNIMRENLSFIQNWWENNVSENFCKIRCLIEILPPIYSQCKWDSRQMNEQISQNLAPNIPCTWQIHFNNKNCIFGMAWNLKLIWHSQLKK